MNLNNLYEGINIGLASVFAHMLIKLFQSLVMKKIELSVLS